MSDINIINATIEVVAEVLECDIDELAANSKLVLDLGADSLDIVDLTFSLGKKFKIKMPQKTVIMRAEEEMGDLSRIVSGDGKLTALGAELLCMGPNRYTSEEAYEGQSLMTIFTETTISHWANLCGAIIESDLSGDELIQKNIRETIKKDSTAQVAC
ncbi:MAG: acyl carrier protein [Pseudohongiellaceae bacterium]|jgi:acyl carrier protein